LISIASFLQSSTQPPQLLTEAELIGLMDQHGNGTDATIPEHVHTVKERECVFRVFRRWFVHDVL
jgi:DNA topoisomerase-3